ncbi:MAG: ABC transporter substrate-binding protein, partial [Candidatus Limnocylindrales bacterium]
YVLLAISPGIEFRFYRDPARLAADYRDGTLDGASGVAPQVAAELGRLPGSRALRYPATTLSAVVLNLRADHPEFRDARVRTALLAAIDRVGLIGRAYAGAASPANGPIPAGSPWFDASAAAPVRFDRKAARAALKAAGWTTKSGAWRLPKSTKALTLEVLSPDELANPALFAAAEEVVRDWSAIGLKAKHVALPPGEFVRERVGVGGFQVAVVDIAVGLDPDLYPLLASSQTVSGGSNVAGLQDPVLDALLVAARSPGTTDQRRAAYRALQVRLAKGRYLLPLAFPDEVVVVRNTLEGPAVRPVADPSDRFWDVLTWRLAVDR